MLLNTAAYRHVFLEGVQNHKKTFPGYTEHKIGKRGLLQRLCSLHQHLIASAGPQNHIDLLDLMQIDGKQVKLFPPYNFLLNDFAKALHIQHAGEIIGILIGVVDGQKQSQRSPG